MQSAQRNGITQTVAYTDSAVASTNAFGAGTNAVRIVANSACHYTFGAAPTATTSSPFLPANTVEYVYVRPGEKISAIRAATAGLITATSGTLWVTETVA